MKAQGRKLLFPFVAASSLIANAATASDPAICTSAAPNIQRGLNAKMKSGVPFEVFSVVVQDGRAACTKALKLHLSLWDNRVRIMAGEMVLGRFSDTAYADFVCSYSLCQQQLTSGKKAQLRVFANPNWEESMARLESRTNSFVRRFFSINWNDLKQNMQKDEFLFEGEFIP
jgi:hypothetical protein